MTELVDGARLFVEHTDHGFVAVTNVGGGSHLRVVLADSPAALISGRGSLLRADMLTRHRSLRSRTGGAETKGSVG